MLRRLGLGNAMGEMIRRPLILVEAVRALFAIRRLNRALPSKAYLEWRTYTAYGDHEAGLDTDDLILFLAWRRHLRRANSGWWAA